MLSSVSKWNYHHTRLALFQLEVLTASSLPLAESLKIGLEEESDDSFVLTAGLLSV